MKAFKQLLERATERPWRIQKLATHPPSEFPVCAGEPEHPIVVTVMNRYSEPNARLLTIGANHVEALVAALERVTDKLDIFVREHPDPGTDASACLWEAWKLLAQIEEEAAQ